MFSNEINEDSMEGGNNMSISDAEAKKRLDNVIGSFAVDGMILDNEQKDRLSRCISGEISHSEAKQEILDKFKRGAYAE